jgi:hypothetical protein
VLARFALWALNRSREFGYVSLLGLSQPTTDLGQLLLAIWRREYAAKASRSELFIKFTNLARQRRQRLDKLVREGQAEEDGDEGLSTPRPQPPVVETAPAPTPIVAPLRFSIPNLAPVPPSAPHVGPTPVVPFTGPQSLTELSSEDVLLCSSWLLKRFRRGELGKITLDDIPAPEGSESKRRSISGQRHRPSTSRKPASAAARSRSTSQPTVRHFSTSAFRLPAPPLTSAPSFISNGRSCEMLLPQHRSAQILHMVW